MVLSDLLQGCSNKSEGWQHKVVTISWPYWTCWNNLATSLIVSTRLLQVVSYLLTTWDKQCEHNLLTACWQTCYKMWDFCLCSRYSIYCVNDQLLHKQLIEPYCQMDEYIPKQGGGGVILYECQHVLSVGIFSTKSSLMVDSVSFKHVALNWIMSLS
jgi:hypothetical protein